MTTWYHIDHSAAIGRQEECFGPDAAQFATPNRDHAEEILRDCQHEADLLAADGDNRWPADDFSLVETDGPPDWYTE